MLQNPEIVQDEIKKGFYEDVKDVDPAMIDLNIISAQALTIDPSIIITTGEVTDPDPEIIDAQKPIRGYKDKIEGEIPVNLDVPVMKQEDIEMHPEIEIIQNVSPDPEVVIEQPVIEEQPVI